MSEIIDIHVHFAAPGGKDSPCYWSKEFEKSTAYLAFLMVTGVLFKRVDIHLIKGMEFGEAAFSNAVKILRLQR